MQAKKFVRVVYDRKKKVEKKGIGDVEIEISLTRNVRKRIKFDEVTPYEFEVLLKSKRLEEKLCYYNNVVISMITLNEPLTLENLYKHLGLEFKIVEGPIKTDSFLDYMYDEIRKDKAKESTKKHMYTVYNALVEYGKMVTFDQCTPENIYAFDNWLEKQGKKWEVTRYNYHKNIKKFLNNALRDRLIENNPYKYCKIKKGTSKERQALPEDLLQKLRDLPLQGHLERARDLFIFAAYTGLAYIDVCNFNFKKNAVKMGEMYYIDGSRIKTGCNFFTPILPAAQNVLKKYHYVLPVISNQKVNSYLSIIKEAIGYTKQMSFHIARHSFATLALSYDIPIEDVAKMLGHKNVKTTQIYAKVLDTTIQRHAESLVSKIM